MSWRTVRSPRATVTLRITRNGWAGDSVVMSFVRVNGVLRARRMAALPLLFNDKLRGRESGGIPP